MSAFLSGNYLSLHGRLFGLFRNLVSTGDAWIGGDGLQSILESAANTLTAKAGGGQSAATPVTAVLNRFTVVATIADSATLPVSQPGMTITIANAAANSMNVFPNTGEQINAAGANGAFAVAGAKTASFSCFAAGQWHSILSA